jgi:hypothetical protein
MSRGAGLVAAFLAVASIRVAAQIRLSDIEVRLVRRPTGGCLDPCGQNYTVVIRGDGTVRYEGSGRVEGSRERSISPDDVVVLVNEFLRARFFNALETYSVCCSSLVRNGDTVALHGTGGADDPYVALTLRIGDRTRTVTLLKDFPSELGRLPELVDRVGGPPVWQ